MNFNGLGTRDVAGAKYLLRLGVRWTTLALGGGAEMWTLPGYGDHLERDNPDLRKQMAAMGGPEGFEVVLASKFAPENKDLADQADAGVSAA